MVEIGCFLGGSCLQWLRSRDSLVVIAIEPWVGSFHGILERYAQNPLFDPCFVKIPDRKSFIESVKINGAYLSALANLQDYQERFIPIQGYSPDELYNIRDANLEPQLIYFDSTKKLDDLDVAHQLFPNAVLCGDDWT